jgi:hypothetical protein
MVVAGAPRQPLPSAVNLPCSVFFGSKALRDFPECFCVFGALFFFQWLGKQL